MDSIWRTLAWGLMVLLALAIAAYAMALLLAPSSGSPFVAALLAQRPIATLAHFGGSALALAVGGFQLHPALRRRFPGAHRWLGRLYVLGVALGGSAGLFMAWYAHGGLAGKLGFALLALSWIGTTACGYVHIRARNTDAHRRWMIRSCALSFAAVTLRLYIPASQIAGIPFDTAYPIIAWACWLPNLAIAELLARPSVKSASVPSKIPKRGLEAC